MHKTKMIETCNVPIASNIQKSARGGLKKQRVEMEYSWGFEGVIMRQTKYGEGLVERLYMGIAFITIISSSEL
jgi:hypothetical protein